VPCRRYLHIILLYWVPERRAIEIIRRPLGKGTKHNCGKTVRIQPFR